jgi:hypothetical protein
MPSSPIDTLAPEKQLLIYCARTRMRPEVAEKIRALAASGLNWDALLSEAEQKRGGAAALPAAERDCRGRGSRRADAARQ